MAKQYLFGAEVNQIQSTLFRTSRQRQVVGGSRLLADFGAFAANLARTDYGCAPKDILVAAGGAFRILFSSPDDAAVFGERVANAYHFLLDGQMTQVAPEEVPTEDDFHAANRRLQQQLDRAKRANQALVADPHAPTTAFCQTSGVGLATRYDRLIQADEAALYTADFAWSMGKVGYDQKEQDRRNAFLDPLRDLLPAGSPARWIDDAEALSELDGERRNVAYLVADGNNMGRLFSACTSPADLRALSDALQDGVRQALMAAVPALRVQFPQEKEGPRLPLLPLILAGDDIFVMLPARFALDFTQRFCLAFEEALAQNKVVQRLMQKGGYPRPTMSAALVFCKGSYPYYLAHRRGETLLSGVKQLVKMVGYDTAEWHSAVAADFIVGGELVTESGVGAFRNLGAYWALPRRDGDAAGEGTDLQLGPEAAAATVPLNVLLDQRAILEAADLARKRLSELRALYAPGSRPEESGQLAAWQERLNRFLARLEKVGGKPEQLRFKRAIAALGHEAGWKDVFRGSEQFFASGIPDLIHFWAYAEMLPAAAGEKVTS